MEGGLYTATTQTCPITTQRPAPACLRNISCLPDIKGQAVLEPVQQLQQLLSCLVPPTAHIHPLHFSILLLLLLLG